jgi:hypothetical protein
MHGDSPPCAKATRQWRYMSPPFAPTTAGSRTDGWRAERLRQHLPRRRRAPGLVQGQILAKYHRLLRRTRTSMYQTDSIPSNWFEGPFGGGPVSQPVSYFRSAEVWPMGLLSVGRGKNRMREESCYLTGSRYADAGPPLSGTRSIWPALIRPLKMVLTLFSEPIPVSSRTTLFVISS